MVMVKVMVMVTVTVMVTVMITLFIHKKSVHKDYIVHLSLYFTGTGDALKLMAELLRIFIAGTCRLQIICMFNMKNCVYFVLYETAKTNNVTPTR